MSEIIQMPEKLKERGFSYRQIDVITDVCKGSVNREIANRLMISEKGVKYHMTNILRKAKVKNRTELAAWASSI